MKQLILLSFLLLSLIACQTEKNKTKHTIGVETAIIKKVNSKKDSLVKKQTNTLNASKKTVEKQKDTFNWLEIKSDKKKLIATFQANSKHIDKALIHFLDAYEKLENKYNKILVGLASYDSLNTLAYAPNNLIYKNALKFKNQIEKINFLSIAQEEGMIYLTKNTAFIKSTTRNQLDSTASRFVKLYCDEIDSICCGDAAIGISKEKLVKRAFLWGNLLNKSANLAYNSLAKTQFHKYCSLIYLGLDNTPSFDSTTKKFNPKLYELMQQIINKYPNSKAAKAFKVYSQLLEQEKFKQTKKIADYINFFRVK